MDRSIKIAAIGSAPPAFFPPANRHTPSHTMRGPVGTSDPIGDVRLSGDRGMAHTRDQVERMPARVRPSTQVHHQKHMEISS